MSALDGRTKGLPAGLAGIALSEIAAQGWNVLAEDLPLPLAVLRDSALAHNSRWMRRFIEQSGAELAPHVKTSMSPELIRRQIDDGVWGLTVANTQQLRVVLELGAQRVIVANQVTGRRNTEYLAEVLRRPQSPEIFVCADSVAGVRGLAAVMTDARPGAPLNVLVEVGLVGGRAGCRTLEQAIEVARAVRAAGPGLVLRGVEGFEGLATGATPESREAMVQDFLDRMLGVVRRCAEEGLFTGAPVVLSAGGSAFFDIVARSLAGTRGEPLAVQCVLRSGCYLIHDSGLYEREAARLRARNRGHALPEGGLRAALEVWGYVQSRPEPGLAILTMGRRDVSYDIEMPRPLAHFRPGRDASAGPRPAPAHWKITALNDQHAYLALDAKDDVEVGDMVASGVSHPCTTFDKWRFLVTVDDRYNVIGGLTTLF